MADGVIVGWRAWKVRYDSGLYKDQHGKWRQAGRSGLRLFAWTRDDVWPALVEFDALQNSPRCIAAGHPTLSRPDYVRRTTALCQCGLHAFKSKAALIADLDREFKKSDAKDLVAYGRVSLWGKWVEAERGWRARFGYPYDVKLLNTVDTSLAQELAAAYAIDVACESVWNPERELAAEPHNCDLHGHQFTARETDARCDFCGVLWSQVKLAEIQQAVGPVRDAIGQIPTFDSRAGAYAWFQTKADSIMRWAQTDPLGNEELARQEITRLRDVMRPWLDAQFGPVTVSTTGATFRVVPPIQAATNKHLPPPIQ